MWNNFHACRPVQGRHTPLLQRFKEIVPSSNQRQSVFAYLENLLVCFGTMRWHIKPAPLFLSLVKEANISLKTNKCVFLYKSMVFPGHVIRHSSLEITKRASDAIHVLKILTLETQPPLFVGWCKALQWLVPTFSPIISTLTPSLRKSRSTE